ncbi:MAG: LPXTG cell wall anchor domain-containing protein [Silvibacterium sp.]|nr:LPXTG cell wall anchor domain-containing protein [Silvibacterium sp.]
MEPTVIVRVVAGALAALAIAVILIRRKKKAA